MKHNQIINMVKATNRQLLSIGFTWKMIDDFWNECINEGKNLNEKSKA